MLRSHRRVVETLANRPELPSEDYPPLDVFYHFCCDVLHLRDWILDDIPELETSVRAAIRKSPALAACSDVANGSKHRTLTQKPKTKGGPAKAERVGVTVYAPPMVAFIGTPPPAADCQPQAGSVQYIVHVDAGDLGELDALQVAADAVAAWDTWLTENHLDIPTPGS